MEERRSIKTKLILHFLIVHYASKTCTFGADTLSPNQTVKYNQTIVSQQGTFELGFFQPGNSMNQYVGIWYKKLPNRTVVWVANRNRPLTNNSGELSLTFRGVLVLRDANTGSVVWTSANSSSTSVRHPIGQLLDTGNFIIYDEDDTRSDVINQDNPIWQSFDFPTDTLLPGMKLGWNLVTGIEWQLKSWKSEDDPDFGEYCYLIDPRGYPQAVLKEGSEVKFRRGPWNGLRYTGSPSMRPNWFYNFTFVINKREIYYQYNLVDSSVSTRLVLQSSGRLERLLWIDSKQEWDIYTTPVIDRCDQYDTCGSFGICNISNSPVCLCLKGFEPMSPDEWRDTNWLQGCRHTIPLDCKPGEGFNRYPNLKLPDTRGSWYNQTMTLAECEKMCKRNCSCSAYTNSNISGTRSGCLLWFGGLIDIRTFAEGGDTLYIRMSASELDTIDAIDNSTSSSARKSGGKKGHMQMNHDMTMKNRSDDEELELPLFGLSTILKATSNFSVKNKLGEGGFGPVYKGVLDDGHEVAVKRLAKTSTQGLDEFKSEVISISKLQHRNLVKLLGCCIEEDEKMLIYEYMANKGLDSFIFDRTQSQVLDWPTRYHIINGIARGLLYLHQDSRLRIIHRDLKVSNILLDTDMNPKISDFGMARTFGGNQVLANTNRVVGTYGYMAPEYAGHGIFSIKSDVYSFGVLVLEIVCGEKNREFVHEEHSNNLIGQAWSLHNEGKSLQLVAKYLGESMNMSHVLRSIHVGLLCVQRDPEDRPTMTSVILMLGSESPLPSPKEPGFYIGKPKKDITQSSSSYGTSSNNDISISVLNGR